MPISIVVGGQFGSEGKGKIALEIVRRSIAPVTVVRVGGPNSGHTAFDRLGRRWALRQMPAACVDRNVDVVFPAGSYLDIDVLFDEIRSLEYPTDRIFISEHANIITQEHKKWEIDAGLTKSIGSTGSGVGAAVMAATAREARNFEMRVVHAREISPLAPYIRDTTIEMRRRLSDRERIVIEGSQGFGLSLLDGGYWPKATGRLTTAAGALAESGLSPLDVDDVTLVLRSFPIRVAGESGPLPGEMDWGAVAAVTNSTQDLTEYTTVTKKVRRVGRFDPEVVKRALAANNPSRIAMNHLDYIGSEEDVENGESALYDFLFKVQKQIGRSIDWLGFSPACVRDADYLNAQ